VLVATSTVGARKSATGMIALCAAPCANSRSVGDALMSLLCRVPNYAELTAESFEIWRDLSQNDESNSA
jgi:hypothetical protein